MCACCEFGQEIAEYLLQQNIHITRIVSLTSDMAQKNKVSGYTSYENFAAKHNIPIYYPKSYALKNEVDYSFFQENAFDLLILGGWQRLIPEKILKTLGIGGIGVHGSSEFLPKGRGRSPINWSLIEGKQRFIMHTFLMKAGADNGDIINFKFFDINKWDTCQTLYYKYSIVVKKMLVADIPKLLQGQYKLTPQIGEATYYPKRTPEDGLIDWSRTVFEIYNFIRALTKPYPGAFSYYNDNKVFLWKAQPFDTQISYYGAQIGEVVEVFPSGEFVINCNSGLLLVTSADITPEVGYLFKSAPIQNEA